ncbi:MAG: hypothetical protein IT577_16990 [Verrucomicrobiae bacterium]|nr:hypothetical protein [Verrucomicrobiae bacterium]
MSRVIVIAASIFLAHAAIRDDRGSASDSTYASDMKAFLNEVDEQYPLFDRKGTRQDWNRARASLDKVKGGRCA